MENEQNRTTISKSAMLQALVKTLGVVTPALEIAGIARSTFYKWLQEDAEFQAEVDDVANIALDFAESQLHRNIKDGSDTAVIFYLKTKGKKRGYVEKTEVDSSMKITGLNVTYISQPGNEPLPDDE